MRRRGRWRWSRAMTESENDASFRGLPSKEGIDRLIAYISGPKDEHFARADRVQIAAGRMGSVSPWSATLCGHRAPDSARPWHSEAPQERGPAYPDVTIRRAFCVYWT
jgi:hypothetical protein